MANNTILPIALSAEQSAFIESVKTEQGRVHLLTGGAGTGKTVTLIAAVAAVANSVGDARVLVIVGEEVAADMIRARLADTTVRCPVVNLTKSLYREHASSGGGTLEPGIYVATEHLVCQKDVSSFLRETMWDLLAIEEGVIVDADAEFGRIALSICGNTPLEAGRYIVLREADPLHGAVTESVAPTHTKLLAVTRLEQPFLRSREVVEHDLLRYRRQERERSLLTSVAKLAGSLESRPAAERLLWASLSCFAAIGQELLQLRNHLAHGLPLASDVGSRASLASKLATPDLRPRPADIIDQLMKLADEVDDLPSDSKVDALVRAICDEAIAQPAVVFVNHSASHRVLEVELADVDAPLHVVSQKAGDAERDLVAFRDFAAEGGVLLVSPAHLKGVEINAASGVLFDLPRSPGEMHVTRTRLLGSPADSATLYCLFDEDETLTFELDVLEEYGFAVPE